LVRATAALASGFITRALMQSILFLIVVRTLSPSGYGQFVSILAVASTLSYLSGLGAHVLLVRNVSRGDLSFSRSWGAAIVQVAVTGPAMMFVYLALVWWLFPVAGWDVILLVGGSELLLWPFAHLCAHAYQGLNRMGHMSRLIVIPVLFRLIAALVLLIVETIGDGYDPLRLWSTLYAVSTLLATVYALACVRSDFPAPIWPKRVMIRDWMKQGAPFSVTSVSIKLYADSDKVMLASLVSASAAGLFSAGYRLVDLAMLPIYGLLSAIVPKLFQAGETGPRAALRVMMKVVPWWLLYLTVAASALWTLAPWITLLLGNDYAPVVEVIRWMFLLPLFSLPRYLFHYVLNTSDRQGAAMFCFVASAIANIALNLWWIPLYGWKGALAASYLSELLAALLMLPFVLYNPSGVQRRGMEHG